MNTSEVKYKELNAALMNRGNENKDSYLYGISDEIQSDYMPEIKRLFKETYDTHKADDFYWEFCHIDVYKKTFKSRLREYQIKYDNTPSILDFVENELNYLSKFHKSAEDCYYTDTCTTSVTMKFGRLYYDNIDLNNFYDVEDPVFIESLFISYNNKMRLLEKLRDLENDKKRTDALVELLDTPTYIRTIDPLDEPSKLRLIELGVLKEEPDGTFKYINGFYDHICNEAIAYVKEEAYFLASDMWDNEFINFDPLPIDVKLKVLNKLLRKQRDVVKNYLAIDPLTNFEAELEHLLNYKNVLYIHLEVHRTEGIADFKNNISIIAAKLYYDNLNEEHNRLSGFNPPVPLPPGDSQRNNSSDELYVKNKLKIEQFINSIDSTNQYNYVFKDKNDFDVFVALLANYFSANNYQLPPTKIILKKSTKTRFAKVLREIHKELSDSVLVKDSSFFDIIRTLKYFDCYDKDVDLYRVLIK